MAFDKEPFYQLRACPPKPVRLTSKEYRRAETDDHGRVWTVISRPYRGPSYLVALVRDGQAVECYVAKSKAAIGRTAIELLRWRDKMSQEPMRLAWKSRHRWGPKVDRATGY